MASNKKLYKSTKLQALLTIKKAKASKKSFGHFLAEKMTVLI